VTDLNLSKIKIEQIVKRPYGKSLKEKMMNFQQFAYISSHDLQEPARKISTFIEALEITLGD
jgi:light-regulated signal transduction histidine kinase (bacteriophytochrome)